MGNNYVNRVVIENAVHLGVEADVEALKACDKADADCVFATWQHAVCHIIQIICTAGATNR